MEVWAAGDILGLLIQIGASQSAFPLAVNHSRDPSGSGRIEWARASSRFEAQKYYLICRHSADASRRKMIARDFTLAFA